MSILARAKEYISDGSGGLRATPSQPTRVQARLLAQSQPFHGRAVFETSDVGLLRKPPAIVPQFPPLADLARFAEYEELAAAIGYIPADVQRMRDHRTAEEARREVVSFLLDSGMPYYDNGAVSAYMNDLCRQETETRFSAVQREQGHRIAWRWVRTDGRDQDSYYKPIPVEMLRRAAKVKQQFKDAAFAVTDYQAVNPDPFISVTLPTFHAPVIFGVWDEPGFGAIGEDKALNQ